MLNENRTFSENQSMTSNTFSGPDGRGRAIGKTQSQGQDPTPPLTIGAILERLDYAISRGHEVLDRATRTADKFLGGEPRAIGSAKDDPESGNMLLRLEQRQQRLSLLLNLMDEQVGRVENAL